MEGKRKLYKKIVGVPVIPGLPNSPITVEVSADEDEQLSFNTELPSTRSRENSVSSGSNQQTLPWKLGHKDFLPKSTKEKSDENFEPFQSLVNRANEWLRSNAYARLFTCETILWMTIDKQLFTDNGIHTKSMSADKKTKCFRGLRIWYYSTDDTFYNLKLCSPAASVAFTDYMPEGKSDTVKNIISRINAELGKQASTGKVMRLETLHLPNELDSSECYWKEEPHKDKSFIFFLRVFFVHRPDLQPEKVPELGIYDFWPEYTQRSPHNQGYETFSEVWKNVARWIHSNTTCKMINIQSVFIKYKKDSKTGLNEELTQRCNFMEHGSAYSSIHQARTEYMQIARVVYLKKPEMKTSSMDKVKLAYKLFAPVKLLKESVFGEEELTEATYEDLGQVEDRINNWIQKIGNQQLIGMETIPVRMVTGGQEVLGSDATFLYNCKERNVNKEPWRVNIRLYLTGRIQDLPTSPLPPRLSRSSISNVT